MAHFKSFIQKFTTQISKPQRCRQIYSKVFTAVTSILRLFYETRRDCDGPFVDINLTISQQ